VEIKTDLGNLKLVFAQEGTIVKAITEWEEIAWEIKVPEGLGSVPLSDYAGQPYCIDCIESKTFFFLFGADGLVAIDKDKGNCLVNCIPGFIDKEGLNFYKSLMVDESVVVVTTKKTLIFDEQALLCREICLDGLVKTARVEGKKLILKYYDLSEPSLPLSDKVLDLELK